MAEIIVRPRMGGKTTELIRRAAETGAYIVCTDRVRAQQVFRQAKDMGLSIPFPVTAREWQKGEYHQPGVRGLLFDDLDRIVQHLSSVQVFAATWTAEPEDVPQPSFTDEHFDPGLIGDADLNLVQAVRAVSRVEVVLLGAVTGGALLYLLTLLFSHA